MSSPASKFAYKKDFCDYTKNEILKLGLDPDSKNRKLCYQILKGIGGTVKLHEKNRKILIQCSSQFRQLTTKSAGARIEELLLSIKPEKYSESAKLCLDFLKQKFPKGIVKQTLINKLDEGIPSLKLGFVLKDTDEKAFVYEDLEAVLASIMTTPKVFIECVSCDFHPDGYRIKRVKIAISDILKFKKALGVQEVNNLANIPHELSQLQVLFIVKL